MNMKFMTPILERIEIHDIKEVIKITIYVELYSTKK